MEMSSLMFYFGEDHLLNSFSSYSAFIDFDIKSHILCRYNIEV